MSELGFTSLHNEGMSENALDKLGDAANKAVDLRQGISLITNTSKLVQKQYHKRRAELTGNPIEPKTDTQKLAKEIAEYMDGQENRRLGYRRDEDIERAKVENSEEKPGDDKIR